MYSDLSARLHYGFSGNQVVKQPHHLWREQGSKKLQVRKQEELDSISRIPESCSYTRKPLSDLERCLEKDRKLARELKELVGEEEFGKHFANKFDLSDKPYIIFDQIVADVKLLLIEQNLLEKDRYEEKDVIKIFHVIGEIFEKQKGFEYKHDKSSLSEKLSSKTFQCVLSSLIYKSIVQRLKLDNKLKVSLITVPSEASQALGNHSILEVIFDGRNVTQRLHIETTDKGKVYSNSGSKDLIEGDFYLHETPQEAYLVYQALMISRPSSDKWQILEEKAVEILKRIPGDPHALAGASAICFKLGLYKEALELCESSLKIHESANAYFLKAIVLNHFGNFKEAIKCFQETLKLNPLFPNNRNWFYGQRGFTLFGLRQYGEAIQDFDKHISLKPKDPFALFFKWCSLFLNKQYDEGKELLTKDYLLLCLKYFYDKQKKGVIIAGSLAPLLEIVFEVLSKNMPESYDALADLLAVLSVFDNYVVNSKIMNRMIEIKPTKSLLYAGLAASKFQLGEYAEALSAINKYKEFSDGRLSKGIEKLEQAILEEIQKESLGS